MLQSYPVTITAFEMVLLTTTLSAFAKEKPDKENKIIKRNNFNIIFFIDTIYAIQTLMSNILNYIGVV